MEAKREESFKARSNWLCRRWALNFIPGFGCTEAIGDLDKTFPVEWWCILDQCGFWCTSSPTVVPLTFFHFLIFLLYHTTNVGVLVSTSQTFFSFCSLMPLFPKGLSVILFWCCYRFIFPAQISLHSRFMYPTTYLTSAAEYFLDMSDLTCPRHVRCLDLLPRCLAAFLAISFPVHKATIHPFTILLGPETKSQSCFPFPSFPVSNPLGSFICFNLQNISGVQFFLLVQHDFLGPQH